MKESSLPGREEEILPRAYPGTPGGVGRKGAFLRAVTSLLNLVELGVGVLPVSRRFYRRCLERLEARDVVLSLEKPAPGISGLRALVLSDLHAGPFLGRREAELLLEKGRAAGAEAVFLAGDLIAQGEGDLELLAPLLEGLDPPLGVFAVTGNHEHYHGDPEAITERLEGFGVQVLRNRGVRVERKGGSLWIAGVDDPGEGRADLEAALSGRRGGEPAVLICHHPDFFPAAVSAGVVLQVSGHTHGGQVSVLGWTPMKHTRMGYLGGVYRRGGSMLYVSRGVGAILLPLRIGAPPEIPVLRLA